MTLAIEVALVALAAVGAAVCVALLPQSPPSPARAPAPRRARPQQLTRLESLVSSAGTSALQTHAYLRPVLVEIASRRLAARGRSLDRMSEEAGKALLGEELWEIVRPNRPFPENRHAPGVSVRELRPMLEVLERL
jgi:hypothetical protein